MLNPDHSACDPQFPAFTRLILTFTLIYFSYRTDHSNFAAVYAVAKTTFNPKKVVSVLGGVAGLYSLSIYTAQ